MREIWLLEMLSQPRAWRQVLGTAGGDALHVDLLHDGEQRARCAGAVRGKSHCGCSIRKTLGPTGLLATHHVE